MYFLLHLRIRNLLSEEEINHQPYPALSMLSYNNQCGLARQAYGYTSSTRVMGVTDHILIA